MNKKGIITAGMAMALMEGGGLYDLPLTESIKSPWQGNRYGKKPNRLESKSDDILRKKKRKQQKKSRKINRK